jgi:glycosyltransferase involved in cell wall biosynthesis
MTTRTEHTLSIVLTALNEEAHVADAVREATLAIADRFADYEILCIDDGSTDRTGAILDDLASRDRHLRVVHNPSPRNLGGAYKQGIALARCDYLMWVPGDNENPRHAIEAPLELVGKADMVVPYPTNDSRPMYRRALSSAYTQLLNSIFRLDLPYFNGTVLHRVDLLRSIEIKTDSFSYQTEALVKLVSRGHSFVTVPIVIEPKAGRKSKAIRMKNFVGVARTIGELVFDVEVPRLRGSAARGR